MTSGRGLARESTTTGDEMEAEIRKLIGWETTAPLSPGKYHRVFQTIGTVDRAVGDDALQSSRGIVLDWVRKRKGWKLPAEDEAAGHPLHFEDEHTLRSLSIESSPGLWAIRLDDPCREVIGRQWRVELVLIEQDDRPAFGCTLSVMVPPGSGGQITPGIPGVINQLARTQGLEEAGRKLDGGLWEVDRPHEVDDLIRYIESPGRPVSLILISKPRHGRSFVDPHAISQKLAGVAIVAMCTADAAQEVTERYGRELGLFGDAIRLYRVAFDADVDTKWRHPLFLSHWKNKAAYLIKLLKSAAMSDTVSRRDEKRDLPSFALIRQIVAEQRLASVLGEASADLPATATLKEEVRTLQADRDAWQTMALDEERRATEASQAQQQTRARLYIYSERIRTLEAQLDLVGGNTLQPLPDSLESIDSWVESSLTGRLILTPRALRAVSRSDHAEPRKIYEALKLLGNEYWAMKVGEGSAGSAKACFDAAEERSGFRIGPTGIAVKQKQFQDEYQVLWEGNRYSLDLHLVGSDSRDVRRGLRVYFAWDSEQQLVVVGHLPTHLTNTLT